MKAKLSKEGGGYDLYRINEDGKRVTFASTQDFKQKLSLKNCQAIERGYDLDKLKYDYIQEKTSDWVQQAIDENAYELEQDAKCFIEGFQKAMELMNKKFSAEQVLNAFWAGGISQNKLYLESQILEKSKWDVEIVTETIKCECSKQSSWQKVIHCSFSKQIIEKHMTFECTKSGIEPKLDADGCLILKRIE
jgi:hypothetical protein